MLLSEQHELTELMQRLRPDQLRQVLDFARFLEQRYGTRGTDQADSWSEEDITDINRACADHANETVPYEDNPDWK